MSRLVRQKVDQGLDGQMLELPDGIKFDVLALGRNEQPAARGGGVRVVSAVLPDARPDGKKQVSSRQAEISWGVEGVNFTSLGQTFCFLNEVPLHAAPSKFNAAARLYHGDVLRFGGNRDGKPGGGLQEHVYRVDALALGARPPAAATAAAPTAAPMAAAPAA